MIPKVYKYANGGKVAMKGPKQPKPQERFSAMDAVRGTVRRKREQALGLRDGGPVAKPKMPGKETRAMKPAPMPPPQSGTKPKRIGPRTRG